MVVAMAVTGELEDDGGTTTEHRQEQAYRAFHGITWHID